MECELLFNIRSPSGSTSTEALVVQDRSLNTQSFSAKTYPLLAILFGDRDISTGESVEVMRRIDDLSFKTRFFPLAIFGDCDILPDLGSIL